MAERKPSDPRRRTWPSTLTFLTFGLVFFAGYAFAQTEQALPPPSALKKLSVEQLMDIEVTTVSRRESTVEQSATAIHVITQEDIRLSGATSIPEALRLAPGLEVARIEGYTYAISSRGFNGLLANKFLVLMDGRVIYTPTFSGVFWDRQDTLMEDIDRIEVIHGPGGAFWSANAVNGVNIITKNARETQGALITGGAGTEEKYFGGARYGGKLADGAYYRGYAKYFDRDNLASGDLGSGWRLGQAGFRIDWEPFGADLLTFQGDIYHGGADEHLPFQF
jgi:iron complex outermembrane recepter protein